MSDLTDRLRRAAADLAATQRAAEEIELIDRARREESIARRLQILDQCLEDAKVIARALSRAHIPVDRTVTAINRHKSRILFREVWREKALDYAGWDVALKEWTNHPDPDSRSQSVSVDRSGVLLLADGEIVFHGHRPPDFLDMDSPKVVVLSRETYRHVAWTYLEQQLGNDLVTLAARRNISPDSLE